MKTIKTILIIAFSTITCIFVLKYHESYKVNQEVNKAYVALCDSLDFYRDKSGTLEVKTSVIESTNTELLDKIKSKDEQVKKLREEVGRLSKYIRKGGSISTIKATVRIDTVFKTIYIDSTKVYNNKFEDKWVQLYTSPGLCTDFSLKVNLNPTLVVGYESYGFLNMKKKPFSMVKFENPYVNVEAFKTYKVVLPRPKRFGIGIHLGYDLIQKSPTLSVGINYNLLEF